MVLDMDKYNNQDADRSNHRSSIYTDRAMGNKSKCPTKEVKFVHRPSSLLSPTSSHTSITSSLDDFGNAPYKMPLDSLPESPLSSPLSASNRYRRSLPVAKQSFYALASLSSDVASSNDHLTKKGDPYFDDRDTPFTDGTNVSRFGGFTEGSRLGPFTTENSVLPEQLSSWHPDWGPGRRLRHASRRRRLKNFGRRRLWTERTRPSGGYLEALRTLRRVSKPLRAQKIRDLMKASRALGALQEAASDPYPPNDLNAIDVNTSAGQLMLEEIRFFFGVCLSVYPTSHVVKHYGLKLQAASMPESVREFLSGTISAETDDIVIVDYLSKSEVHRPAYCLAVDNIRSLILLILRGSVQFSDAATDVQCEIVDETRTHDGMERAAGWFDHHLRGIVSFLCSAHPTYKIVLCGHSLGGGVASLLAMKWLRDSTISGPPPTRARLKAFSYGAPAVCTANIAASFRNNIWSITNGRDIISRLSYGSVRNMTKLLLAICEHSQASNAADSQVKEKMREAKKQAAEESVFSIHNLMAAVADVSERVEKVVHEAEEAINQMNKKYFATPTRGGSTERCAAEADINENTDSMVLTSTQALSSFQEKDTIPPTQSVTPRYGARIAKYATEMAEDISDWIAKQFGPCGIRKDREPLLQLLNKMRELFEEDERTILTPAGRWFMSIPAAHFVIAGRSPPVSLMPGGWALFDASECRTHICQEMIFRRRAVHDHYPQYIGFSIGSDLSLGVPDELANEMDRSLGVLGLEFKVRPCWKVSNMNAFRYKHLKQQQALWSDNDNPGTRRKPMYPPLLTALVRKTTPGISKYRQLSTSVSIPPAIPLTTSVGTHKSTRARECSVNSTEKQKSKTAISATATTATLPDLVSSTATTGSSVKKVSTSKKKVCIGCRARRAKTAAPAAAPEAATEAV